MDPLIEVFGLRVQELKQSLVFLHPLNETQIDEVENIDGNKYMKNRKLTQKKSERILQSLWTLSKLLEEMEEKVSE